MQSRAAAWKSFRSRSELELELGYAMKLDAITIILLVLVLAALGVAVYAVSRPPTVVQSDGGGRLGGIPGALLSVFGGIL